MSKPIYFAATANAESCRLFYGDPLELTLKENKPYARVFDEDGVTLRERKVDPQHP